MLAKYAIEHWCRLPVEVELASEFRYRDPVLDRDTLVVFSNRRSLKQRTGRRLLKDFQSSAYPITPNPFLVTPDGIAPSTKD